MPGSPLLRTVSHCFRTISSVVVDLVRLAVLAAYSRRALAAENLLLRKQLALFPGAPGQTTTSRRFHPLDDGDPESHVPVAGGAGECPSGYAYPLAPQRIPAVLALEVQTDWKTPLAQGSAANDPSDGRRECDLGRRTHRQRVETKTRNPGFAPYRGKYLRIGGPVRTPDPKQRWLTFIRNHANVIVACDFFVVIT